MEQALQNGEGVGTAANGSRPARLTGAQRQESILGAAAEVFARRGYEGARIEEIAAAAGVSKALIYEHFPGKRDLYAHIMQHGTEESLRRVVTATMYVESSVEKMEHGLRAFLDFVAEQPDVWRVTAQEVSDPEIVALGQSLQKRGQQKQGETAIAELLAADEELARQGLSREHIDLLGAMIHGASVRAANWWLENPGMGREQLLRRMMRLLWLGLEQIRNAERDGNPSLNGHGAKAPQ